LKPRPFLASKEYLIVIGKQLLRRIAFNKRMSPSGKPAIIIIKFFCFFFYKISPSRISFASNLLSVLNKDKQNAGTLR